MKKILLFTIALLGFSLNGSLNAQCGYNGQQENGTTYTPNCSAQTVSVGSGAFVRMTVTNGVYYDFGTCGSGYDTQLTGFNSVGTFQTGAYNDDNGPLCSGNTASFRWQAGYSGEFRPQVNTFSCVNWPGGGSATLSYRKTAPLASNTTSTAAICEDQTKGLVGSATYGSGSWSITAGGGSISGTTYTPANISVNTNVTVRYTANNGGCTAVSDRTFLVYADPIVTNTTSTAAICEDQTKALSGSGSVGSGVWSIVSGGGSISGTTYTPANIASNTNVTVRYTWTNGTCSSFADRTFLVYADPIVTNTTSTAAICEDQTKALSGSGSVGSGVWSIVSGGGSISGTTYTPANIASNTNVTVRYTWTNGTCSSFADRTFLVYADPIVTNTTSTAAICEDQTKALSGSGSVGSGVWSIVSGGGSISGTTYTPANIASNTNVTVRYTWTNGTCSSFADRTFLVYADVTVDQTTSTAAICEGSTKALSGTSTGPGTATYSVISGSGSISGTTYSTGSIASNETVTIRYSKTNGTCSDFEDVSFTVNADVTVDQTTSTAAICEGSTKALSGTSTGPGTATYSVISGSGSISGTTYSTGSIASNETVTIRYSKTNGACSDFEDVSFTVNADVTVDQTTSTAAICEGSTKALSGTSTGPGTATYSVISGSGSISGTTYSTGSIASNETVTIRYSKTNGACSDFEDVSFTVNADVTVDQTTSTAAICEGSTKALSGTSTGPGTATYSVISGSGSISGTTYSTGSIASNETVTIRYSKTNGACSDFEDVSFTVNADVTVDQTTSTAAICEGSTKTLSGTSTGPGTATYSVIAGSGSISGTTYSTGSIASNETVTIRYSKTNGACSDFEDVSFTVNADVTVDQTTSTAAICEGSTKALSGTSTGPGTATYSVISGSGSISGTTYSTGSIASNETVTIRYSKTNGACSDFEDVSFDVDAEPTTSAAGTDFDVCVGVVTTMAANNPTVGTGEWTWSPNTITYQPTFGSNDPDAQLTFNVAGSYTGTWTISNGACTSSADDVIITVNDNPTVNAGGALTAICQGATSTAMGGSVGGGATGGTWSGGAGTWTNATDPANATYTAGASESGSIILTLTTSGGSCGTTSASKTITVNENPTASAGIALSSICQGGTSTAMFGSVGGGATGGTWSGGAGTWTNASDPANATYTAGASESGNITLTLTTSGGSCGTATATNSIFVIQAPTLIIGGAVGPICQGATSGAMGGGIGGGATGSLWSGGTGTWTNASNPTIATYTAGATESGSVTLTLTVFGTAPCSNISSTKTIMVDADPSTSAAGTDFDACVGLASTMAANNPTVGAGTWTWSPSAPTYTGGTSASDFNAQVIFATAGTYTGTWTISNGACTASADDVVVTVNSAATNVALVSGTVATATAVCVESPWTYYADPAKPDEYLFAIKKNGNTFTASITITDLPGTATYSSTGGAGPDRGTWLIGRHWNAEFTSGSITTSVDIRFFVDPAEVTQASNEANAFLNTTAFASTITPLTFFKTTGTNFDPSSGLQVGNFTFTPTYLPIVGTGTINGVTYYELSGITSFSGGTGGFSVNDDGSSLPVELLSFEANTVNNQFVKLDWATATEINNDGFEVLRSTDGVNFERITWIEGNGNSTEINEYSYNDYNVAKGMTYYYQLKQIDFDGQSELFDVVSARIEGSENFFIGNLVPNPSKDNQVVRVDVQTSVEELIDIQIYNHMGVRIAGISSMVSNGENDLEIDITDLAAGTYFINFESSFGTETRKLVVIK